MAVEGLPAAFTAANLAGYAYLTIVGTARAYALWFRGIERLPAASVSLLGLLSPLVAAVVGWAALDQRLTGWQMLGTGLALGAVVLGQGAVPAAPARPRNPAPNRKNNAIVGATST